MFALTTVHRRGRHGERMRIEEERGKSGGEKEERGKSAETTPFSSRRRHAQRRAEKSLGRLWQEGLRAGRRGPAKPRSQAHERVLT